MENGWIKLWRKLEYSQVFKNEGLLKVFIWCLMRANTKTRHVSLNIGKGKTEVKVEPGQFIYGRHKSANALSMKPETVRTRLNKLQRLGMITKHTSKNTNQYTIFSVTNWNTYQPCQNELHQAEHQPNTTDKNNKEVKDYKPPALKVIQTLNEKTGKKFRPVNSNLEYIIARLKEDYTLQDCLRVIDNQVQDPYFIENPKFLNPETLFRKKNFAKYLENKPQKRRELW